MKETNKLNGKDLMTIGLFTAVYLVIYVIVACAMGMIPIMALLLQFVSSFVLGIPMILYFAKIKKFGMILITYIIVGAALMFMGTGAYTLILAPICALLAEILIKIGKYKNINLAVIGNALYWVLASEEALAEHAVSMGTEYIDTVLGYFANWWVLPAILLSAFIGGVLGGLLGKKVLRKHFIRSGVL